MVYRPPTSGHCPDCGRPATHRVETSAVDFLVCRDCLPGLLAGFAGTAIQVDQIVDITCYS